MEFSRVFAVFPLGFSRIMVYFEVCLCLVLGTENKYLILYYAVSGDDHIDGIDNALHQGNGDNQRANHPREVNYELSGRAGLDLEICPRGYL